MDEDRARAGLLASQRTEVQFLLKDTEGAGRQNRASEDETGDAPTRPSRSPKK